MPPVSYLVFTGLDAIASGVTSSSTNHAHILGYDNFMLYCKGDKDFIVYIDVSEDHNTWYRARDKFWSDVLAEHVNATLGAGADTITPSGMLQSALIHNTHAANTLSVSFDGGVTSKAIDPGKSLSIPDNSYSYQVSGAAGTTYEIVNLYYTWGKMVKANTNAVYKFAAQGSRYLRVQVKNLDGAAALDADISIKAVE
jgi:hypothetical protein